MDDLPVEVSLPGQIEPDVLALPVLEGLMLGSYDPGRWKTSNSDHKDLERIVLAADDSALAESGGRAAKIGRWVNWTRDLVNAPPNELTPELLAQRAAELGLPNLT